MFFKKKVKLVDQIIMLLHEGRFNISLSEDENFPFRGDVEITDKETGSKSTISFSRVFGEINIIGLVGDLSWMNSLEKDKFGYHVVNILIQEYTDKLAKERKDLKEERDVRRKEAEKVYLNIS